ncbi:MAG: glycine dehydrogenase, partial [Kiritimatiellia bacterium]
PTHAFVHRHLGPRESDLQQMAEVVGYDSLDALVNACVPPAIRLNRDLDLPKAKTEAQALAALRERADSNEVWRSYLGFGYHDTLTPPVILRNLIENPGWYTAYTPYQAEISQGRLEALLVFQTMVQELTGMEIANASMLDEATAGAEAMAMCHRLKRGKIDRFVVDHGVHPNTIAVIQTRAEPLGIEVLVADVASFDHSMPVCGVMVQYPNTDGTIQDWSDTVQRAHDAGAMAVFATDLLALTVLKSPGEMGADITLGNSQRFGVPLGWGGPHAAFLAAKSSHRRTLPGRIIGVSKDADGNPALRMALQTREQHIRRDRATSNICTAQVLLANIASMYAVWHGPEGLVQIATRTHRWARTLAIGLQNAGFSTSKDYFDTVAVTVPQGRDAILAAAASRQINLREMGEDQLVIALDETVGQSDIDDLLSCFAADKVELAEASIPAVLHRNTPFLTDPVFHLHRSETEMMRYLHRLAAKDLALDTAMIPLGSCTMKLNAAAEMIPITWRGFGGIHPCVPASQVKGYLRLVDELEASLAEITGFSAVSLQPNAGSQGEYTGLLCIRAWHHGRGDEHRNICLIPTSAHGTNPASAVMAGMKVVTVKCDDQGNIDVADLTTKAQKHANSLAALMVTYPSTHGVFEETISEICAIIHEHGGQVYLDGANMNAMVGLCRPGDIGADVCHLNLHKTFAIPHGGGGPGVGPIGVAAHLVPYLPNHAHVPMEHTTEASVGSVSAAAYGSPSILPITWAYIAMLGRDGVRRASEVAILNANYIAKRLSGHYDVLYTNHAGLVAHECILDTRPFKASGVSVDDIAKRLMDYGFHAPTMSWPVIGTLMVEPTESESRSEVDRFIDAMISIRQEIDAIANGTSDPHDNALKHAPHTAPSVISDTWDHKYGRMQAAFPTPHQLVHKYWPTVRRIDNVYGDKHLFCTCDAWPTDE